MGTTLEERVEAALETIRPALELEGSAVELVAVERGIARVRLRLGRGAGHVGVTGLLAGIQRTVQAAVGEIRAVINQDLVDAGYAIERLAGQRERFKVPGSKFKVD